MTDPTPPHRRSPMEHERDACPLGEDCDLTIAWLAGAESKHDEMKARIEALEAERDRLREALAFYVQGCDWQSAPTFCDRPAHMCCKEARAALKGEGE